MKPDSTDKPAATTQTANPQWQGLDDYVGNPEFLEAVRNEFPEDASEFTDEISRRRFVGLMGASVALATGAGCYLRPAPQRKILPYTTQPDQITPGVPLFFATTAPLSGFGSGVLVRSHEGRPIKVEGNPDHPSSLGGASTYALASILDMYDPDRSRGASHRGSATSLEQALAATRNQLYTSDGKPKANVRLRLLTETVTSPTLASQIEKLLADFPEARWAQHDPAAPLGHVREGTQKAFGKPLNITYDFVKADVVVALDSDFLTSGPGAVRYSRDFAERRKIRKNGRTAAEIHDPKKDDHDHKHDHDHDHDHKHDHKEGVQPDALNRLYSVEAMPTSTGSIADHRLALPGSQVAAFAVALAKELSVAGAPEAGALPDAAKAWIAPLAADLKADARKGKTVVIAGEHQPAAVHAVVAAINSHLGNIGKTVFLSTPVAVAPEGKVIDLKTLTSEMSQRAVDVLLVLGVNAAYTTPADVPFADAIKSVGFTLHLGLYADETAVLCQWHLNEAHYLESWGDLRGHDGTASLQQPLIAPLFNGTSAIEFLANIMAGPYREGYDIVRAYWKNADEVKKTFPEFAKPETFEISWQEVVRGGVIPGTASKPQEAALAGNWAADMTATPAPVAGQYQIEFRADTTIYDGRYANNGWLQELPKPVTKLTWDNAAFMSPATAKALGVDDLFFRWTAGEHGRAEVSIVELTLDGRKVKAPVWVLPNHADGVITVHLGYGRIRAGRINTTPGEPNAAGEGVRGFNAYALQSVKAPWMAGNLTVARTAGKYFMACTQGQTSMSQDDLFIDHKWDRKPVRHDTLATYEKSPDFARIPPVAAGETTLINDNVPRPRHADSQPHDENHAGGHEHDNRLVPLTMYAPNEVLSPNLREEQRRRWAMAIDLNACTGCSACVVACQSENNIPIVGKEQVTKGRAMHWIRVDRYYEGAPDASDSIKTLFQPLMCVQCEKAPCEIVCPVGATVHSTDGLNDMAYNRCVGTRYCSNNCPYKVRRFNFITYLGNDWETSTLKLGRNPDVSVRSRGVMEKCTFCVQRIRGAEIVAEREQRKIRDGEILTACQSACPSGAIVFGDINDTHSAVSRWKEEPRDYGLLAELNTMPRLTHLAIVRNPNPKMPSKG